MKQIEFYNKWLCEAFRFQRRKQGSKTKAAKQSGLEKITRYCSEWPVELAAKRIGNSVCRWIGDVFDLLIFEKSPEIGPHARPGLTNSGRFRWILKF
ncbi:Uncharacterized protein dnm_051330 [Desulfonema magnum]|uniref:Uncharacterized protein n=1 Tax=Desulfonema magnum TaxID=45655 RepID=A0A975GPR4_9BACT|nr:Uncharacterized protein dnm_051330 [Desulfonema magnum]